jgi:hypothetical protein
MPQLRSAQPRILPWVLSLFGLLFPGCEGSIAGDLNRSGSPVPGGPILGAAGGVAVPGAPVTDASSRSARAADAMMQASNPALYESAHRYFPTDAPIGAPKRLFRLTRAQLDLTTQALLPLHYMTPAAEVMPRDPLQTNYEYADNLSFNPANFTPYTGWVEQLAASVRTKPSSVIDCSAQKDAPSCLDAQSRKFVQQAFRGTASAAQLDHYAQFFVTSAAQVGVPQATADLVDLTLTSPQYVYRDEVLTEAGNLAPAQLLQNIAYTLADAPPSALGLAPETALSQLKTADGVQKAIDQVLASPFARQKLMRFFIAWLEVKDPGEIALAPDVFPEFTPEVAEAAVESTKAFLNQQLAAAAPKLKDVTQSSQAFVSDALAAIYGTKTARGKTLTATQLDPTQRFGIFTQPGVIASHSGPTTTRLVKRGVFFTRKVMCLPLGLPPPGVNTTLPEVKNATERERVESATANATCQGCHAFINPFGFMQENYDAMGRWRTTDQGKPINPSIQVTFLDEGPHDTHTPVEALQKLTDSYRFQQCFARQMFRFYMGRDEGPGDDPLLRQMFFGFADGGRQNIVDLLQTLARSGSFSQRSETP